MPQKTRTDPIRPFMIYPDNSKIGVRSTLDASLATVIANGWTINTGITISYVSKPSDGFKKTSSLLTFGFGYKY